MATASTAELWNGRYTNVGSKAVSWFQEVPEPSLRLITSADPAKDAPIVDVGGGASFLADKLVGAGFSDVTVVDLSEAALKEMAARLPPDAGVQRICTDLREWEPARTYSLWHDRATFHFLTAPADQERYWDMVRKHLAPGGVLVVGTFAEDGPTACSGLPITRYSSEELVARMGEGFAVLTTERHEHHTPSGSMQPFTWVIARRL
jgi:SAM-dependent methyltransferase